MGEDQDGETEEGGLKIKDRRRFDDAGNLKAEDEEASGEPLADESSAEEKSESSSADDEPGFVMQEQSEEASESAPIDYSSFILSLATQAMVQLGEMPSPPGVDIPKNPQAAKHTIDVIEMLEAKTAGNLSEAETKLTEEILHSLRIGYVRNQ